MAVQKAPVKDSIEVLVDNIVFYAFFFVCLVVIASFGLIAEA